jgi:plastocyanin
MKIIQEHGESPKMGGQAKGFVAFLAVIAVVIPILLGVVLVHGSLPLPTTSTAATSTSSAAPNTITIPQGAGSAAQLNFSPSTMTVASGTTLTFVDQDNSAPHNVYFTSVPSGATISQNPSSVLMQGDTYTVTLTTPGTYHYECQFHSGWMQGTITVTG